MNYSINQEYMVLDEDMEVVNWFDTLEDADEYVEQLEEEKKRGHVVLKKDMKNLLTISNELMNNIASYMDDDLREDTHFAVSPCSNEVFITVYYNTASAELKRALEDILSEEFGLDIDDIIYSAYYQVYNNLSISKEELNELRADYNTLETFPVKSRLVHQNEKAYIIRMISGDLTVFCQEV